MKDALDVFRKAGATLVPVELPEFPVQAIGFILSAEAAAAFDDLTRSHGIDQLTAQGAGRLAEPVPHAPLRAGGGVHPRAARAHAADAEVRRVDVEGARVPVGRRAARACRRPT